MGQGPQHKGQESVVSMGENCLLLDGESPSNRQRGGERVDVGWGIGGGITEKCDII